jgi:hypothetical protein
MLVAKGDPRDLSVPRPSRTPFAVEGPGISTGLRSEAPHSPFDRLVLNLSVRIIKRLHDLINGSSCCVIVMVKDIAFRVVQNREEVAQGHEPEIWIGVGEFGKEKTDGLGGRVLRNIRRHDGRQWRQHVGCGNTRDSLTRARGTSRIRQQVVVV